MRSVFFRRGEVEKLLGLPKEEREQGFYNCWTRKEAYVKARGEGLYLPLEGFEVSLAPAERAALLRSAEGASELERWSFHALELGEGYAGAVVVEGQGLKLRCWNVEGGHPGAG